MAKLKLIAMDNEPVLSGSKMFVKLFGLVVMSMAIAGIVYMLLAYAKSDPREDWTWAHEDIRSNFTPLYTTDEIREIYQRKRDEWRRNNPITQFPDNIAEVMPRNANTPKSNEVEVPFSNDEPLPPPQPYRPLGGSDQREVHRLDAEHELKLAEALKLGPVFSLTDEVQNLLDFKDFEDESREKTMNEFAAYRGRQAPANELLALQVLRKLPPAGDAAWASKVDTQGWYFGKGQGAIDKYRARAFRAEGRLFDLYEVRPEKPVVMQDGTRIERYYEGVVAMLGPGLGRGEHNFEQRTVMFQSLELPAELQQWVSSRGYVAHDDKLATETVMVSLTGAYLRRWAYSREVKPFSSEAKRVLTQDHLPLLLSADVAPSKMEAYALTDELLQQVRDSLREDPAFLETEAAYFAMLAMANAPDDEVEIVPEIGYFDLAGEETGPRYRGQGIHIVGMLGDNYAPVILGPNISGLRRVFRILVLHDTADMNSPKRYLVDMIEPPTNLEQRAIIDMEARYYRNVFEAESTSSAVRPLLIVRRIKPYDEGKESDALIYSTAGLVGVLTLLLVLTWFILAERRERAKFEASSMEVARARLKKQGGLKLRPLPASGDKPEPPPAPPEAPAEAPRKE